MKKVLIYILVFIVVCTVISYGIDFTVGQHLQNQSPYYLSFASIGANSLESHLDAWAKIKTTSSEDELKSYLFNILRSLNLPADENNFKTTAGQNMTILEYELSADNSHFKIVLESDNRAKETYFIINIIKEDICNMKEYSSKLNSIIGLKWTTYYKYHGYLDFVVDKNSREKLIEVMMKNLKADNVRVYSDGKTCSATAYAQVLEKMAPMEKINHENINVQIAIQTDEINNRTNVIIGSPLILGEY